MTSVWENVLIASTTQSVCGSLADGDERYPRPEGELCECKPGWGGINCNGQFPVAWCFLFFPRRMSLDIDTAIHNLAFSQSVRATKRVLPSVRWESRTLRWPQPKDKVMRTTTEWSVIQVDWRFSRITRCAMSRVGLVTCLVTFFLLGSLAWAFPIVNPNKVAGR
jgi:hypothetical protein